MPLHPDFQKILTKFKQRYGDEEGERLFYMWVNKHKLDPDKPYSVQAQIMRECLSGICEAFQWAGPLIQLLREDGDAKYYKSIALTANISANFNDYSDVIELERASSTLTWRPLNLNHDHGAFLPFPEARVDWAAFENDAVEAIIRIPNSLRNIQRMIENGDIIHVSIEGEPRTGVKSEGGMAPKWYNFTALALLEKDKTLPGDQLTTIEPLFIRESMGRSLVESLRLGEETKEKEKTMTEETIDTDTSLDDTTETPELEEMNQGTCGQCGQCKFFNEHLPTAVKEPNVMASEPSDGYVITIEGGIGPGVGTCTVSDKLVRKNDAACYDGRLRDTPTSADDDERIIEIKGSIEEMVLKAEITDLKSQLLTAERAKNEEIEKFIEKQKELVGVQDQFTRKTKELTIATSTNLRLSEEVPILRDARDRLKDEKIRHEVQIKGLEQEVDLHKSEATRFEKKADILTEQLAEQKGETSKLRIDLNDEAAKRAEAQSRAVSAEQRVTTYMSEATDLNERLVTTHRELTDSIQLRRDGAKREENLQIENLSLKSQQREDVGNYTKEIRDLKQELGKFKKYKKIIWKT